MDGTSGNGNINGNVVAPSPHVMRAMLSPSPSRVPLPPSGPSSRRGSSASGRGPAGSLLGFPTSLPPPLVNVSPRTLLRPRLERSGVLPPTASMSGMMNSMIGPTEDPFFEGATITINQPVGSLSISPNSRDVCLASRKGLYILDLKNLESAPRFVPQGGTWQIADCQWSPHAVTDNLILSTSSQKLLVWDLKAQVPLFRSVDAHERAVTDINWHAINPNLMATIAMDAGIRGWDLRMDMSRPYMRLSAWGAAGTQVKWNRRAEHILATAHGKDVLVWDDRKGSIPLDVLKAHDAKIYGIDWDRRVADRLVTCSLDKTIKQWHIPAIGAHEDKRDAAESFTTQVISTGYPIWRARNLPFGFGILSLPQRGETALELYSLNGTTTETPDLVERFEGSADVVKEFVWRVRGGEDCAHEDRDFQLVTWSKDRKLRVWPVPREVVERVGYKRGAPISVLLSRKGARDITFTASPTAGVACTRMPLPLVDLHTPTPPSGIARQRLLANSREAGMTRGGKRKNEVIDQVEWLSKVVKTGKAGNQDSSTGPPSRAPSVAGDSTEGHGSRSRSRTRLSNDAIRPLSLNRAASMSRSGSNNDSTCGTGTEPMTLKDEVLLVRKMFPKTKVNIEKAEVKQGKITMSLNGPWANGDRYAFVRIHWSFPPNYPYGNDNPTFELERNATVSKITRHRMTSTIKEIRATNKQCLVAVTEFLLGYHERTGRRMLDDDDMSDSDSPALEQNVPMLVRTTGAVFGPNGQLACFFPKHTVLPRARTSVSRSPSGRHDAEYSPLVKAITALSRMENPHKPAMMIKYRRHVRRLKAMLGPVQARSTLTLHNVSHLVSEPDVVLAAQYSPTSVDANLLHALEAKRLDHAEVWASLRALLNDPPPPYSDHPAVHREMSERRERFRWERDMERKRCVLDAMFERLMDKGDIQLLALVSCILLEYERCAPPPPEPISMVEHSPRQDYFVLPPMTGTGTGAGAGATPLTVRRRHSSQTTPTTPPVLGTSGPSSFRTSGWSQILMNPSSISLRGMALTPRDRTSFDMAPRTPKDEYDEQRGSGVTIPKGDGVPWGGTSVPKTPIGISPRRGPERRDSAQRQGRDPGVRPLRGTGNSPNSGGASGFVGITTVGLPSGLPRERSGSSDGPGASGWSAISGRASKVSFGSSSPLRRAFSRPGGPVPAPLPNLPERRRRPQTCSVRLDIFPERDTPPPSLLRQELMPLAEVWKLAYADFLFRAGLVGRRAALLQYAFWTVDPGNTRRSTDAVWGDLGRQNLVLASVCTHCSKAVTLPGDTQCAKCHAAAAPPVCSVCRLPIKGLASTCTICTHTSHLRCLRVVLDATGHCPACACKCLHTHGLSGAFTTLPRETPPLAATYGFSPEAPEGLGLGLNRSSSPDPAPTFGFMSAMNALTSLGGGALTLNLHAGPRGSPSPTGLAFDGPHAAHSHSYSHSHSPESRVGPGPGPGPPSTLSVSTEDEGEDEDREREREREQRERDREREQPVREGLLARSRLRALGSEGILGW